jgi:hypothetical protein
MDRIATVPRGDLECGAKNLCADEFGHFRGLFAGEMVGRRCLESFVDLGSECSEMLRRLRSAFEVAVMRYGRRGQKPESQAGPPRCRARVGRW